jgi:hypothetical protein
VGRHPRPIGAVIGTLSGRLTGQRRGGGFLDRMTLAAAAFATAPIRYATRPVSARDIVGRVPLSCGSDRTPDKCLDGTCGGGSTCCGDGWTTFCCSLVDESNYACPSYSYIAGYWKCTLTITKGMCSTSGVRWYIDCNVTPGKSCPDGCTCRNCSYRRTCCNCFRYGQCNKDVAGTTYVVCRLLSCIKPWSTSLQPCTDCDEQDPPAVNNPTCFQPDGVDCLS